MKTQQTESITKLENKNDAKTINWEILDLSSQFQFEPDQCVSC